MQIIRNCIIVTVAFWIIHKLILTIKSYKFKVIRILNIFSNLKTLSVYGYMSLSEMITRVQFQIKY